jgi:membrane protease YdiL (CAAX protease family)
MERIADDRGPSLDGRQRGLSAIELAVGAFIVIGHNVFRIVPNEVPILFVLALLSIRLREGGFAALGLGRPSSWPKTILIAAATAIAVLAAGQLVTEPLARMIGLHENHGAAAHALGGLESNAWSSIKALLIVWSFAAFGEEIGYRRYLLGRAADLGNRSTLAYGLALVLASVLFGFGHYYQGPAGIFTTACDGFILGAAYLLARRNLWVAVIAHGLVDTIGIALLFFGLAD